MTTMLPVALRPHQLALAGMADEPPLDRRQRTVLSAVAVLLAVLFLAAALVPIGGAVVGSGQLGAESRVKRIAHPLGGVVREVLVRDGQRVRRGQVLMRFDDTVSGTDATLSLLSLDQLRAQRARLEAEQVGANAVSWPAELAGRDDGAGRRAMADEQRLFAVRRSEAAGLRAQLEARIAQLQQQAQAYRAQIAALRQQMALIEPEREGLRKLREKGLVTLGRFNHTEREAVDFRGGIAALEAQIAQAQSRIAETREQMIQQVQTRRADAGTLLAQVNTTLNQQQLRSVTAGDSHDRSVVRAPYDGVVDKLAFATTGDVVRAAETIMEIVPDRDRLLMEASINPSDIDQVRRGQSARVRFSALSATASPEVAGRVEWVAAERTTEPASGQTFFRVRVALDPAALPPAQRAALRAGLPAEVFVETGSRSMLSYLTKPIQDQFARSFRDN